MPTLQWQMSYRASSSTFTRTSVCASRESSHRTLRDRSSRAMLAVPSDLIGGSRAKKRHCIHIGAVAAAGSAAVAVALLGRCTPRNVLSLHLLGPIFFHSFSPFLPLCFCDCSGGCTPHSSSVPCCSQVWSIFNVDPPRIYPPHHVPFRCMDCLVCSTGGLCPRTSSSSS